MQCDNEEVNLTTTHNSFIDYMHIKHKSIKTLFY